MSNGTTQGKTKGNKSEDSDLNVRPQFKGGFSTKVDPTPPDSMGVGDYTRDARKVYNKIPMSGIEHYKLEVIEKAKDLKIALERDYIRESPLYKQRDLIVQTVF